jgi:hypothetical protein
MKFITPKLHAVIDYLVVVFLLASPMIFGMTGNLALCTYALGIVHFMLTIFTNFSGGAFKIIPLAVHGFIELIVGIALIIIASTLLKDAPLGKPFYMGFGIAVLVVFLFTDYKGNKAA